MITLKQTFRLGILSLAVSYSMSVMAASPQEKAEIAQLRQEIQELRTWVEQQQVAQNKTAVDVSQLQTVKTQALSKQSNANLASGAEISFYGNVRLDASYQAEGSAADRIYNNMNKVPLEGHGEASDRFKSTLSATRLGTDLKSQLNGQDVRAKIEVDFLGGTNFDSLRIRHAYINYENWLIGQTWTNFSGPEFLPETADAMSYVGGTVKRTPQVRYSHKVGHAMNLILALEDSNDASSKMRFPAFIARVNYKINPESSISLRAMANEKRTDSDDLMAWGMGLGLNYTLTENTTLKADYFHVKGDSSFVAWSNPGFSRDESGKILDSNEFDSIILGLTQQFNPKWHGTLGFGYMKADISDRYKLGKITSTEINKQLWQGWANVFYNPVKPINFGFEYVYGERKAIVEAPNGSNVGKDNRVSAVAIYSF